MENIYLAKRKIDYREKHPINDDFKGAYGSCTYYNNGILKVFHVYIDDDIKENIENNLKRKSNIIMYPKCKLFEKRTKKFRGYFMDEAPGKNLLKLKNEIICGKNDISFEELLYLYYDMFIPELKKEEVVISDMKSCQVFIDDNIYLTDTDLFYDKDNSYAKKWLKDCSYRDVFHANIHEMNYVFKVVFNDIGNQMIWLHDDELRDVNYIYKYFDEIRKVTNNSVKTLREYCLCRK